MKRVAIIGAGFTGLTAGYELSKKGFSVTIIEKTSDIGGLAGGFTIEGAPLEKAYHHLFRTDTDILSLCEELGMKEEVGWHQSKVGMLIKALKNKEIKVKEENVTESADFVVLPFNGVKDLLMYRPLPFVDRLRAGAVLFFLQKYKNWQSLISLTAETWMTKWSGKKVMAAIWGPLLSGKFSIYASKVSMAWLWARIHIRANSRKNIFDKELLAYPRRGFISIAEKLAEKIAELQQKSRQDVIKTATSIERITYQNGKPTLTLNGKVEEFDTLLSTIPQQALNALISSETVLATKPPVLLPIDYLGAVVLVFSSTQSLSDQYWHNVIAKDAPFLVFLQHTNLVPAEWYNNKSIYYIGVYLPQNHRYLADPNVTEDVIKNEWFDYLSKLFPKFNPALISEAKLFKFPFAQHVVDTLYPEKIPPYQTAFPYTYSANFAQIFPEDRGTNYAVREGRKIADLIAANLIQ